MTEKEQGDTKVSDFVRTGEAGQYRFFITEGSVAAMQAKAHAAAKRRGKKVTCMAYLAVANGLKNTVRLTRVEIAGASTEADFIYDDKEGQC